MIADVTPKELLEHHFTYEMGMLWATEAELRRTSKNLVVLCNALIESFWLHARNLEEFFRGKQGARTSASTFTDEHFVAFLPDELATLSRIVQKINNQITHLSARKRTQSEEHKIDAKDRAAIIQIMTNAFTRFKGHLLPKWQNTQFKFASWALDALLQLKVPVRSEFVASVTGPTGPVPPAATDVRTR